MYAGQYTSQAPGEIPNAGLIPVATRWVGSWRLSIERQAHSAFELTRRYDREAAHWQQTLAGLGISSAYETLATDLYQRVGSPIGQQPIKVLECGAGTACLSIALAQLHHSAFRISAIDISAQMIQQAGKAFAQAGLEADLEQADIRNLPQADNSQHVVIAAHVLEHLADPGTAIAEMYRVLKPGGLLLLCCTRRSISGRWIQLKWRTHTYTDHILQKHLSQHGFMQIEHLPIDRQTRLHQLSLAVTARKPK